MEAYTRLNYDIEYHLERARRLRGAYMRRLLRQRGTAAIEWFARIFRPAAHPHNSAAH